MCSSRRLAGLRRARVETPRDLSQLRASALAREDNRPDELIGLSEALAEMPPKLQRVVLLREWQGLSYGEIGAELGVSQSAVETLLFRARRDLAKRLRGLLDLGPLFGIKALLGGATVAAVAVATLDPSGLARPSIPARARTPIRASVAVVPHATTMHEASHLVRAPRRRPIVRLPHVSSTVVVGGARRMPPTASPVTSPVEQTASTVTAPVQQTASTVTAAVEQTASAVTAPVEQTASTITAPVEQTTTTVAAAVPSTPPPSASTLVPGG